MLDGDFVVVRGRRKKRGKFGLNSRNFLAKPHVEWFIPIQGQTESDINEDFAIKKVLDAKASIGASEFVNDTVAVIRSVLEGFPKKNIEDAICYGLGHFAECHTARFQLALLLTLAETFHSSIFIHDPIFYGVEVRILKRLGLNVIAENEEGKRKIKEGVITLLYFPHCSKQLTNNFLWCNWGSNLENCLFLGNSFSTIINSQLSLDSKVNTRYVERILPYVKEFHLENNFKHLDTFSDTSLHTFPSDQLGSVEEDFWKDSEEPVYRFQDTEFITKLPQNGHPSNPSDPTPTRI